MSDEAEETSAPAEAPAEAPAPEAVTKAVEEWAEAKGMFPQMIAAPRGQSIDRGIASDGTTSVITGMARQSVVMPRVNASYWKFAAAKAHNQWPIGKPITEAEFDAAVLAATDGITLR